MPPRMVSHYRLLRRLGAGGMGEVFLAQDSQLERPVALKVMSAELAKDPNQCKRFRAEAKAASGLTHPHICVIHEVGKTEDGRPFLAMEYVEGQTLNVVLQQRRLRIREILRLGIEVAEALDAAHARGLVHRDIKPENIMLDRRGAAKVLDFGLAKWFAPDHLSGAMTSVAHTQTGMLIGTPQYMSPEQALGRTLDPRTDLFSLGVVLYELVAGQRPFLGKTVGETINNIVNQSPAPLGLENPVFSPALDDIIFKCLEKDPEKRYAAAQELAADLRKLKEDSEQTLAATTQERTPAPVTPASGERPPTALWRLAARAGAGRNMALGWTIGFVVIALVALGGWALLRGGKSKTSIAVLPFVNMSADKADEYLSDGISEEMITALSKITALRVKARTSSFAFKGKNEDIQKIGEQLRVSHLLEGSVAKAGTKLRITAQLIKVSDGNHVWSETYDREMQDIFAVRSEVAQQVAAILKLRLLGEERQQLAKRGTENAEAYRLYLQGRYLASRGTDENLKLAIEGFGQAIAMDRGYALAHAALASCYYDLDYYTGQPVRQTFPKAQAAALKALELDGSLAEARMVLAAIKCRLNWDWKGAEEEYRRAIALNPNSATAHDRLSSVLFCQRRFAAAATEMKLAQEIDPLSLEINIGLAFCLSYDEKAELGIEILRQQIAQHPSSVHAHNDLGWVYFDQGRWSEAIAEFETVRNLKGSGIWERASLGCAYARVGRTSEAREILRQLQELPRQGLNYHVSVGAVQHALGDDEAALDSMQKALEENSSGLTALNWGILWKDLRPHPRAQAILRKMNLVK